MTDLMNIVNEQDEVIGQATVAEVHKKGILHRAVHVFIIDSQERLFCRQRSSQKQIYPGYWSTSIGAHVLAGQIYDVVAAESLKKHLGIDCELKMIGKARVHDRYENEISATYIGYSDKAMNLDSGEIQGGKFFTVEEVRELAQREGATPHLAHSLEIYLRYKRSGRN